MTRRSARTIRIAAAVALLVAQYFVLRSTAEPSLAIVLGSPVVMFVVFAEVVRRTRPPTGEGQRRS